VTIPKETLEEMVRVFRGLDLSDEEIDKVQANLETYLEEMAKLEELDLSSVFSARLLNAGEGSQP
jgi:Asp-tRNA(Asn)/Glu-tRNA(Gln) amidotransferase C subunit